MDKTKELSPQRPPLADSFEIRETALFWANMYKHHNTITFLNFRDNLVLGFTLKDLGFVMDCGKSYCDHFGEMEIPDLVTLRKFLPEMSVEILGDLIYSQWRYWNHWSDYDPMNEDDFQWFVEAFERLAELTR